MKQLLCGLVVLGLFVGGAGWGRADYTFTTIDVPGSDNTSAYGITSSGQIVGDYNPSGSYPFRGFVFSNGGYTAFDVPNAVSTRATSSKDKRINNLANTLRLSVV